MSSLIGYFGISLRQLCPLASVQELAVGSREHCDSDSWRFAIVEVLTAL